MNSGADILVALTIVWGGVSIPTVIARLAEVPDESAGAVAAGVLWPVYLPYRLFLLIRNGRP